MKFYRYFFLFVLLIPAYKDVHAQLTKVYGTIVDKQSKNALPFVNIIFKGNNNGTSTNEFGSYSFQSTQPFDSIIVSTIGYVRQTIFIRRNTTQRLNIELEKSNEILTEVVVKKGKNPAIRIMDSVIKYKQRNNQPLPKLERERYEKFQMYFGKYANQLKNLKAFENYNYLFKYTDSVNGQSLLPFYMSETIHKEFVEDSLKIKENVLIARKSTGDNFENFTTITDRLLRNVNIYDNYFLILDKSFESPLSVNYNLYYKYELEDNVTINGHNYYKLLFTPKWKEDFTFSGELWVDPETWAIQKVNMEVPENINLNFVKSLSVSQEYKKIKDTWLLSSLETFVTFSALKWQEGESITVARYTSYKNIAFTTQQIIDDYANATLPKEDSSREVQSEKFWKVSRHKPLKPKEKYNYMITDTISNIPVIKLAKRVGTVVVSGYMELGKLSLYQVNTFYSRNPIEGNRFKFGLITNRYLSKRVQLNAYGAYGAYDKEFKYKAGILYVFNKSENRFLGSASYKYDLEQLGVSPSHISHDNVITIFSKINRKVKLTFARETKVYLEKEWAKGMITRATFMNKEIRPLGNILFRKVNTQTNQVEPVHDVTTSEIQLNGRFSFRENFYVNEFKRIPLGTIYPILLVDYTLGLKNIIGSDYNYQKLKLNVEGKYYVNPLGYIFYNLEGGKIFGTVPFPLSSIHPANQSLDVDGFNVMNYFEFASDKYVSLYIDHHFDGFFFNKIPYIKKAKLREVFSARGVIGQMSGANKQEMVLPYGMKEVRKPYIEYCVGLENIFKLLTIEYIWRGTYISPVRGENWGIKARFFVTF